MGKRGMHKGHKILSDEFLISKLKEAFAIFGSMPTCTVFKKDNRFPSITVYEKRFGSWNKALLTAGITTLSHKGGYAPKGSDKAKEWGKKMIKFRRKEVLKNPFVNLRMRFEVLNRDNFTCQYCGKTPQDGIKLVVDHRNPVSNGGKTKLDNLITSCFECNAGKSNFLLGQ